MDTQTHLKQPWDIFFSGHLCAINTHFLKFLFSNYGQIPWIKFQHYCTAFHLSCLVLEWCSAEIKLQKSEIKKSFLDFKICSVILKSGIVQKVYPLEKEQTSHCSLFIPLCLQNSLPFTLTNRRINESFFWHSGYYFYIAIKRKCE